MGFLLSTMLAEPNKIVQYIRHVLMIQIKAHLSPLSISDSYSFIHLASSSQTHSQDVIPLCPLHIQDIWSMTTV